MFTSPRPQKAPAGAGGKPAGDGGAAGASGSARPDGEGGIGHRRQPSRTSEGSSLASDVEPVASIPAMNAARASVGSLPELAHSLGAESEESDDDGDAGEEIASLLHQGEQSEQMRLFDLAVRMSGEVDVRDHKRNLKKHKACFTGRVAVQWMLTNGVARTVDDAVATGQKLSDAGLVKPVAAGRAFLNRSFLYRFGDGMDRYVQAARWCLSQEMGKIRGEVKDVCAVVDRHTAATRAISAEHAAAMERVELVMFEMRTQLAWTRAAVFMLAVACLFLTFVCVPASEDDVKEGGLSGLFSGLFQGLFRGSSAAARLHAILPRATHALVAIVASALSFSAGVFVVDRKSFDAVLYTADHRYFLDGTGTDASDDEPDSDADEESVDGDGRGGSIGDPDRGFLAGPGSSRGVAGLRRRLRRRGSAQNLRIDVDATEPSGGTGSRRAEVAGVAAGRVSDGTYADKYVPLGPGLRSLSQRGGFRDVDSPRGTSHAPGTPTRRLVRLTSFGRFFGMSPRAPGSRSGRGEEGLDGGVRPEDQALPPPAASSAVFGDVGSKPVGLRLSPEYPRQWIPSGPSRPSDGVSLPAQVPFEFETELFKGKAVIYLRGLSNTPERVFKGKARAIQFSVQGRFKREVAMDDLHFGLSLARPLRNLPTRWLLNLCTRVVQSLGAQYSMDLSDPTADRPYMLAPIILAAQTVSCAAPGREPDLTLAPIEENARLTFLGHGGKGVGANERRRKIAKIIRDAKHARRKAGVGDVNPGELTRDGRVPSFDVDSTWTFSFWQSQIDVSKYSVDLGVGKFDLVPIMDGQPIALLCQTSDASRVGFRFEVWHERLLQRAHSHRSPDDVERRPPRDADEDSSRGDGDATETAGRGEAPEEAPEEAAARPAS